ncbi:MAG: S1C family serine protease, partial [Burkholderiales bacterium]
MLYSGPRRSHHAGSNTAGTAVEAPVPEAARASPLGRSPRFGRVRALAARHAGFLLFLGGAALAALIGVLYLGSQPRPQALTQDHIEAAVLRTLEDKTLPSRAAKAAELVRPSVVRVRGFGDATEVKGKPGADLKPQKPEKDQDGMHDLSVGSGVVIVDTGVILTNLHVVAGAK